MTVSTLSSGVPSREVPGCTASARRSRAFLIVPLVLVNLAAIWGQAGWAETNLHHGPIVALLFALAVESIGVYLAWESHESLMADQSSLGLRLGSYGMGLLAGVLNFLHFQPEGLSTAVAFGALSAVSPWLWSIWSRSSNRNRLAELGMVDVRGVKLGTARKLWHPIKSLQVARWSAWEGITNPSEAVQGWELHRNGAELTRNTPELVGRHTADVTEPTFGIKEQIIALRDDDPRLTTLEIAKQLGCSDRWVRKVLSA